MPIVFPVIFSPFNPINYKAQQNPTHISHLESVATVLPHNILLQAINKNNSFDKVE